MASNIRQHRLVSQDYKSFFSILQLLFDLVRHVDVLLRHDVVFAGWPKIFDEVVRHEHESIVLDGHEGRNASCSTWGHEAPAKGFLFSWG